MNNSTEDNFDFQAYLQSNELDELRNLQQKSGIIRTVSASISVIWSATTICHILRSHKGLSSTYHRLVFGLCVGDLMASFAWIPSSIAVPKDMQYLLPAARGNMGTCTAQGFILTVGAVMASFYNCSICFYYLSIITFNKNDDYIKSKLEPWLHGMPIISAIVTAITGLILQHYNTDGQIIGNCYPASYHPPHCRGLGNGVIPEDFTVPCGRGDSVLGKLFNFTLFLLPVTLVPSIFLGTMVTMYRTVRNIERKMLNYGASALRLRAHQRQQARAADDPNEGNITRLSLFLATVKCKLLSMFKYVFGNEFTSRSNNARSQKRAVLYMAMSYCLTWVLMWVPFYILRYAINNNTTGILQAGLQPLQGLYTMIVYMSPKVRHARNTKRGKLPWRQAIAKAWLSRGEKDRAIVTHPYIKAHSMRQRLQKQLSRFVIDRRSKRSSTTKTSSLKGSITGAIIVPPSAVQ